MRKFITLWLSCVLFLPELVWASVNVVVIAPQEGEYADFGRELAEGVKIAANETNAQGGILGHKINVIVADDRCNDRYAVSMAQMLSVKADEEDKVSLVVGPYCDNEIATVADIYAKAGILQIMPLPASAELNNNSFVWKLAETREKQAKTFFDFYMQRFSGQNVALVYNSMQRNDVAIAAVVQKLFLESGQANKLTVYAFDVFQKDYDLLAKEVLLNNQVVYIVGNTKETAKLVRNIRKKDERTAVFVSRYLEQLTYDNIVDSDMKGIYYLGLKNFKDNPSFAEKLVNLRLKGMEPVRLGVYGYGALSYWVELVKKSNSFSALKLQAIAKNTQVEIPWGLFQKDKIQETQMYGVFEKQGEEYIQIY